MNTIRQTFAVVDDHMVVRQALKDVINQLPDYQVLFEAGNGNELKEQLLKGEKPGIILLDLQMPIMDGYETIKYLKNNFNDIKVIIVTAYVYDYTINQLLQNGARAILRKDIQLNEFRKAIIKVDIDGYYFNETLTCRMLSQITKHQPNAFRELYLTSRELDFLKLSCSVRTYHEIACEMGITFRKVDKIRGDLFFKLNVKSRVGLSMTAMSHGLIAFNFNSI